MTDTHLTDQPTLTLAAGQLEVGDLLVAADKELMEVFDLGAAALGAKVAMFTEDHGMFLLPVGHKVVVVRPAQAVAA